MVFDCGKKSGAGFTLIELIIAIAVLAILSTFLITSIDPLAQIQKASDGRRKSDLTQIQRALELYYQDNKEYPTNTASYQIQTTDASTPVKDWGTSWAPYMNLLPKDLDSARKYVYVSTGQSYRLYASLERGGKDPQSCYGGRCPNLTVAAEISSCGATYPPYYSGQPICNYGVSSSNVSP